MRRLPSRGRSPRAEAQRQTFGSSSSASKKEREGSRQGKKRKLNGEGMNTGDRCVWHFSSRKGKQRSETDSV